MSTLTFADTHNMVAFLEKPAESVGFEEIVDFMNAHTINYALTINHTIYNSCIKQFWATAKAKTVNGEAQLQALMDGKQIIITESIVRRDLQLEDAEGVDCLPTTTIFKQLTLMGYEKLSQKLTFYKAFFSPIMEVPYLYYFAMPNMVKNLENANKFLMYPRFVQVFLDKQLEGVPNHNRIYIAPTHTKKVFGNMKMVGKGFSGRETPLFQSMVVQAQKDQDNVADEAVNEEMYDSLVRAATTASSLEVKQDSGNILKTQSKATPNEVGSLGTTSGGGNTPQSSEDSMQLHELMELCTNLQKKILDLETSKTTQAAEIASLKKRVKKLERRNKLRIPGLKRLRKVSSARMIVSFEDEGLGDQEDSSKQGRKIGDIDADEGITLVDETRGRYGDDMFDTAVLDNEVVTTASVEVPVSAAITMITDVEVTLAQALVELKMAKPKVKGIVMQEPDESTIIKP
ncbi:hypothetical protein Tco_0184540 [Tanacetum coccineum]